VKILQVHNIYKLTGGEDSVLDAEKILLQKYGHNVSTFKVTNDNIKGFINKIKAGLSVSYSPKSKEELSLVLRDFKPDLVHVHNFFPLLTPSIYDACVEKNIPVIQTLHNYRTMCPGALLMRDGKICELCVKGSAYKSVLHGCYRDSIIGTFAVARMVENHRAKGTWNTKVNRFIALTEFARNKFIEAGFPKEKIRVKSNFSSDSSSNTNDTNLKKNGALFVGRLSQEKGLGTLIETWSDLDIPLKVAGTGPLESELTHLKNSAVTALGMLDQNSVRKEMSRAAFLVMPSEWYEGFPMVLVEAFSQGLPVVASRLGGMAEIVEDGITGLHFETGNEKDLAVKVQWLHDHPEESRQMGLNARKVFEQKYTADKNYEILMDIYQDAINDSKKKLT
jgi:glycosyltransferase involved in cell wall biosynthesis